LSALQVQAKVEAGEEIGQTKPAIAEHKDL